MIPLGTGTLAHCDRLQRCTCLVGELRPLFFPCKKKTGRVRRSCRRIIERNTPAGVIQGAAVKRTIKEEWSTADARHHLGHKRPERAGRAESWLEDSVDQQEGTGGERHKRGKDLAPILPPYSSHQHERRRSHDTKPQQKS